MEEEYQGLSVHLLKHTERSRGPKVGGPRQPIHNCSSFLFVQKLIKSVTMNVAA